MIEESRNGRRRQRFDLRTMMGKVGGERGGQCSKWWGGGGEADEV